MTIEVFGSVARGDATEESDVDFLVEMLPHSGFGIGGLKWRLEELLRCKVDVVPESGLNPLLRNDVLREARSL